MEKVATPLGVGRGKGHATNVPERPLIQSVKLRPLLYDKKIKDYRKPGVSDAAWNEVAVTLGVSVSNCKKRWKSLRDTFIKYYRQEVMYSSGESKRKLKMWNYYQDLTFLKQHVELFRLEDSSKECQEFSDGEKCYAYEEENGEKEVYELKVADEVYDEGYRIKEDHLLESYEEECSYEDITENDQKNITEYENYEIEGEPEEIIETVEESHEFTDKLSESKSEAESSKIILLSSHESPPHSSSSIKNITDPDERYLMSCLPAFKRFTAKQKAYVRMGIEKLFYEVEFEDDEPAFKKSKS